MEQILALPPSDTTDEAFLREVDENLRADQLIELWRTWGRWAIAAVVGALVIFGGYLLYSSYSQSVAAKQGEQLDKAIEDLGKNKAGDADPVLKTLATSGRPGFSVTARFTQADELLNKKDNKGAAAKLGEIANDSSVAQSFRDLALIRQIYAEYDSLKPDQVIARLKLLATPASPWFGSAAELVAASYLKLGKRDEAGKLYGQIANNENVPPSIKQRAVQMAGLLGVDAVKDQTGDTKAQ